MKKEKFSEYMCGTSCTSGCRYIEGEKITCHPAVINRLKEGEWLDEIVVIDAI
jgi:hypothetical protein